LRESLAIAEAIGEPRQTWKSLAALGRVHRARGQLEAARHHYHLAGHLVDRILSGLDEPGLRRGIETSSDIREIVAFGFSR
jgi:hypothetical protein